MIGGQQRRFAMMSIVVSALGALLLVCAINLSLICVAPVALAGSAGNITFTPTSGAAGTIVDVEIRLFPTTRTTYILKVTSTMPTAGGCATAQPIPGVVPVSVGPQGGETQITWPSALTASQYWLCAAPQGGSGPTAQSNMAFAVGTPTATATPFASPTATITAPSSGIAPGATLVVNLTDWRNASKEPPQNVTLVSQASDSPNRDTSNTRGLSFALTSANVQAGAYTLSVTVPLDTVAGFYALDIQGGESHVLTSVFEVTDLSAPHVVSSVRPSVQTSDGWNTRLLVVAGIGAIALLALNWLLVIMRRRKRYARIGATTRYEHDIDDRRRF